MPDGEHRGWYKHDKLPHFDQGGLYQSITYRLDDSLPRAVLIELERELGEINATRATLEATRPRRIETFLDAGYGSCILRHPYNANLVMEAWRRFDGDRYDLIIGVVMPNHVHVLVRIYPGTRLGDLLGSWKSFTSRRFRADEALGYAPHWQRGYWDRFIRDEAHYRTTVRYIAFNAVTAGLVEAPAEWPYLAFGCGIELASVALEGDTPSAVSLGVLASRSTRFGRRSDDTK
ncbi:transposase [Thiorhodococcus mannitoliphagus]|uniref:Transposase n=1 Tax=Thiorhodococcus mannitoliphagus TaxID=329406 RepID=A0A6P1DTI3_9GAMM|nr:transposase [Thiorhodococcus mannitoliphagus]NEX20251.1 transposase [Thiorhodococcus mannitoliphagus]